SSFGLDFATPSVGLGCRSSGVLLYWMFARHKYISIGRKNHPYESYWRSSTRNLGSTERFWAGFAGATGFTCLFFIAFMGTWTSKRL
ncbi:hypothetical protein FRC16_004995, partial [Serendipita sp. 398]